MNFTFQISNITQLYLALFLSSAILLPQFFIEKLIVLGKYAIHNQYSLTKMISFSFYFFSIMCISRMQYVFISFSSSPATLLIKKQKIIIENFERRN